MTSAIDLLRALTKVPPPSFTAQERRILSTTGLPVEVGPVPDPDVAALRAELLPLVEPLDLPGLVAAFEDAAANPVFSGRGYRTFRVPFELMMRPVETAAHDPAQAAVALMPYEATWKLDRKSPSLSAAYAMALATVAAAIKARETSDDSDGEAEACYERARHVLDEVAGAAGSNWLWHRAAMSVTFLGCCLEREETEQLDLAFEALQCLDPYEFGIYEDRAGQLLPRWFGSPRALSEFASASADLTSDRFGETLYARIYNVALQHATLNELDPDLTRLSQGLYDWLERFPSQPLANRAAVLALMTGNTRMLRDLFRRHIRTIHLDQWSGDTQVRKAWLLATREQERR